MAQLDASLSPGLWLFTIGLLATGLAISYGGRHQASTPSLGAAFTYAGDILVCGAPFLCLLLFRRSIRRSLRVRLREKGTLICIDCGYDLRGVASKRCPECGAPVNKLI